MPAGLAHVSVEEITAPESLERLRPQWHDLVQRCPTATPFQSPEWLIPWWLHVGQGVLWTLAMRLHGRLVGLAPLYRIGTAAGAERVLLLGTGITDHLDLVCDWRWAGEVSARLMRHLCAMTGAARRCEFYNLPQEAALRQAHCPPEWTDDLGMQTSSPILPLHGLFPDCLPAAQWKRLQRYRRRAARLGPVHLLEADADNFDRLFDDFLRLHTLHWRSRGSPGVLAKAAIRAFHRQAARGLLLRGQLCLFTLSVDGVTVAALYGCRTADTVYLYLSGFDPRAGSLSPGLLITGAVIDHAVQTGATAVDFLRGREAYKYAWGAQDRPLFCRRLSPAGAQSEAEPGGRADRPEVCALQVGGS